jgi:hypothetical protein
LNSSAPRSIFTRLELTRLLGSLVLLILAALLAPQDKVLGANSRLVYQHGAWVWAALIVFSAASLAGLAALASPFFLGLSRQAELHAWAQALGRTGMCFWLTYLPMSLWVMQINWGGLFLDEPRWKTPFAFAVIGVLLQTGLWLLDRPVLTSTGNLAFGPILLFALSRTENILHPDSPILKSNSTGIQAGFALLLLLSLLIAAQVALAWRRAAVLPRR